MANQSGHGQGAAAGRGHRALERRLRARLRELREEVCAELVAEDEERYLALIGRAREWSHQPVAGRLRELDLEPVNRHLPEIERAEAALARIEDGSYGQCAQCGAAMDDEFLAAHPAAARCARCETST